MVLSPLICRCQPLWAALALERAAFPFLSACLAIRHVKRCARGVTEPHSRRRPGARSSSKAWSVVSPGSPCESFDQTCFGRNTAFQRQFSLTGSLCFGILPSLHRSRNSNLGFNWSQQWRLRHLRSSATQALRLLLHLVRN